MTNGRKREAAWNILGGALVIIMLLFIGYSAVMLGTGTW